MIITTKYDIGQMVFLATDNSQNERMVTRVMVLNERCVQYLLSCGTIDSWHNECEITEDVNIEKKCTN